MKEFDNKIKKYASEENIEVPIEISKMIEDTLDELPEKEVKLQKYSFQKNWIAFAASFAFFFLAFLPNVSVTYAQTMQNIPVVGDIIKVFTIRKEIYEDDRHELNAEIPILEDETNQIGVDLINKDIEELTTIVIQQFYEELELSKDGYGSVYIDYEVITNDETWFTLKLNVNEVVGSSDSYAKIYHIDRQNGVYVQLKDILSDDGMKEVEAYILKCMKEQMQQDDDVIYYVSEDVELLNENTNFYFNKNNDLVIVYNKYDVAPGYMGCPEYIIPKEIYLEYIYMK